MTGNAAKPAAVGATEVVVCGVLSIADAKVIHMVVRAGDFQVCVHVSGIGKRPGIMTAIAQSGLTAVIHSPVERGERDLHGSLSAYQFKPVTYLILG